MLYNNIEIKRLSSKLNYKKLKLYKIKSIRSYLNYKLALLRNINIYLVFYISLLEKVLLGALLASLIEIQLVNLDIKYIIEEILNYKLIRNKLYYLVK